MTISAVVTETEINASVTQLSNSVALTETEINASVSQTPVSANVTSSPVSASVTAVTPISVAVSQTSISASITSNGGSSGVTNHALLTNLDYASAGHTGFQATLTADVDYLTPATAALTYQPIGSYLTDAPSDGTTYGRNNGAWTTVSAGVTNHALLSNLDYASAGHTGFQAALGFTAAPNTRLISTTTPLSGGGDLSADRTIAISQAGAASDGYLSSTDWNTFNNKQATLTLPLSPANGGTGINNGTNTLTVPATGTAALLAVDNTFTGNNLFTRGTDVTNAFIGGAGNGTATGTLNVGVGPSALASLTSGVSNFGLGQQAARRITTGTGNVAIGSYALRNVTTGIQNIAIGANAMSNMPNPFTGQDNVAIGQQALNNTQNSQNIGIGRAAGSTITTGQRNILIGTNVNPESITEDDKLYIHSDVVSISSGHLIYGDMAIGTQHLRVTSRTTTNNAVKKTLQLRAIVPTASTGAAAGFGVGLPFLAETATNDTYQQQGLIATSWVDATNVSRKAKMSLSAYDTAARLGIEIEADGSAAKLGFYGVTTVSRQVLATGVSATPDDIITALQNLGLVKQS